MGEVSCDRLFFCNLREWIINTNLPLSCSGFKRMVAKVLLETSSLLVFLPFVVTKTAAIVIVPVYHPTFCLFWLG